MAEIIGMPKLSDTMEEGVIASWQKNEGDEVEEGDLLAEIETDKATMEYECPADGVLLKVFVKAGEKIAVGTPICAVGEKGESVSADVPPPPKAAQKSDKSDVKGSGEASSKAVSTPSPSLNGKPAGKSSPLARKLAKEKGVDLGSLVGSGPSGRIIARDIAEGASSGARSAASSSGTPVISREDRMVPASMMRQTIAKRLHSAKNDAPHFYLTRSIDMSRVIEWRARVNVKATPENKVSVNDIVMLGCAKALRQHPGVNASWQGESILEYGSVHVSMAVALPSGLITPVIQNTDQLGIRDVAVQSRSLAVRAKNNELTPDDYQGGTFTVSNLGMFGIEHFTAIINPPQAAILAVGATIKKPIVDKNDQVVVKPMMSVTMSCDHRVIDGAMGAQFLQTLVENLEDPAMMLV